MLVMRSQTSVCTSGAHIKSWMLSVVSICSPNATTENHEAEQKNHPVHGPAHPEAPARHKRDLVLQQTWKVGTDSRELSSDLPRGSQCQVENNWPILVFQVPKI